METKLNELAQAFAALGNPNRLRMWQRLTQVAGACDPECSDCDLTDHCCTLSELAEDLEITQPTASHHLKELVRAGLVRRWKVGRNVQCTVDWDKTRRLREALTSDQPLAPVLEPSRTLNRDRSL